LHPWLWILNHIRGFAHVSFSFFHGLDPWLWTLYHFVVLRMLLYLFPQIASVVMDIEPLRGSHSHEVAEFAITIGETYG
jgi:hypothetical protein